MPGILVVEDDENLNRGITFSLKKSGYEDFSAESVKKAKRIASDNNVDVTICDVNKNVKKKIMKCIVNEEHIKMYWKVGEFLSKETEHASYGDAYI